MREKFDTSCKFVFVTELCANEFVRFDFAIGEPELFAEMILPARAFGDFCAANKVTFLPASFRLKQETTEEGKEWNWSLHDATHQRFKPGV